MRRIKGDVEQKKRQNAKADEKTCVEKLKNAQMNINIMAETRVKKMERQNGKEGEEDAQ